MIGYFGLKFANRETGGTKSDGSPYSLMLKELVFASVAGGQAFASAFVPQAATFHAAPNRKRRLNW